MMYGKFYVQASKETRQSVILLTQSYDHSRFNMTPNGWEDKDQISLKSFDLCPLSSVLCPLFGSSHATQMEYSVQCVVPSVCFVV